MLASPRHVKRSSLLRQTQEQHLSLSSPQSPQEHASGLPFLPSRLGSVSSFGVQSDLSESSVGGVDFRVVDHEQQQQQLDEQDLRQHVRRALSVHDLSSSMSPRQKLRPSREGFQGDLLNNNNDKDDEEDDEEWDELESVSTAATPPPDICLVHSSCAPTANASITSSSNSNLHKKERLRMDVNIMGAPVSPLASPRLPQKTTIQKTIPTTTITATKKKAVHFSSQDQIRPGMNEWTHEEWHNYWYTEWEIIKMENAAYAAVQRLVQQQKKRALEHKLREAEQHSYSNKDSNKSNVNNKSFSFWKSRAESQTPTTQSSVQSQPDAHPIEVLETTLVACQTLQDATSKLEEKKSDHVQLPELSMDQKLALQGLYQDSNSESNHNNNIKGTRKNWWFSKKSTNNATDSEQTNNTNDDTVLGLEPMILKKSRGTSLLLVRHLLQQPAFGQTKRRAKLRRSSISFPTPPQVQDSVEFRRDAERARLEHDTSRPSTWLARELALALNASIEEDTPPCSSVLELETGANTAETPEELEVLFDRPGAPLGLHLHDDTLEVVEFGPPFVEACLANGLHPSRFWEAVVVAVNEHENSIDIWAALKDPARPKTVRFRCRSANSAVSEASL